MTDEIALWRQRIKERKEKKQTIVDFCKEHNITKGSYHYWRKKVRYAELATCAQPIGGQAVTFAKVPTPPLAPSALQVTWHDVSIRLTNNQEAHLAAEMITCLRNLC